MPSILGSLARLMRSSCSKLVAGLLVSAFLQPLDAQVTSDRGSQPEMIPRDLVVALITFGPGSGATNLQVGKVPEDAPPELVPPGSQIVGSMTQFDNMVIVLGMPEAPDSAIGTMEARLLTSGWTRPPAPPVRNMPRGFVSSDYVTMGPGGAPGYLCKGDESVNLSSMYRAAGGSLLKLNYNRGGRYPMCRQQQRDETIVRSPFDEAPVPILRAPPGAMMTSGGGGMSGSSDGVTVRGRLSTRLKPAEAVAHYDTQMKAAGWSPLGDGAVDFMAARRYQKKDERNRNWYGTLYAIKGEGLDLDVALQLSRR
jgi:hypothetical protein